MSYYYYRRRGGGGALWFFVFIIVAIFALMMVARNPNFKTWLNSLLKPGTTPTPPPPPPAAPSPTETPPPPSGDGSISQETTCPSGGETCEEDDQGRYDCNSVTAEAYEATWCGSFSGDDLTIKMYGPPHSQEGDCCWCVLHVTPGDGLFKSGGEGPHSGGNCEDYGDGESIGTTDNICVKAVMQPGPTMIGYALMDGQWREMSRYTGHCGCEENSMEKTGDQVTFRNDGNFETTCATVKPLGAGGITPAPAPGTTPPAEDEEDEDEDEEEDEEEDSPPAATPPPPQTTCPARCEPLRNAPQSYQACCQSGGAGVARMAMRKAMYSSFQHRRGYGGVGRRRKIGNLI